jgi:NAD(P)-dependent dehydrogenase (short-subunit alcohol dehydrogenase family)
LADINSKALEDTAGNIRREIPDLKVVTHKVDVGDEQSCIDCVRSAAKAFGRIDYVLNNVGIGGNHIPTVEQDSTELQKVLNLNFVGLWICQREQVKQMLTQERLRIPCA